ncbi:hypothetical protein BP5796_05708 [Coleophoma crateriformis]|uniref:Transcription factor domain-containing protein n=1 Tax=Coleophoma crateriformis TaxID=565419 RepID=A0A3D8RV57_9HELO|nr:hypothetical protein BP5796_05708 [Coleophoma crateriformis]
MSDPLFFNAVMIKTLGHLIHVNGAEFSSEALGYQVRATRLLKDRISNPAEASSPTTIFSALLLTTGAILANDAAACQVHLYGIKQLLAHGGKSFEKSEQYQVIQQLLSWTPGSSPVFSQRCAMVNEILLSQALFAYPKTPNSMLNIGPVVVLQCCSLSTVLFVEMVLLEGQASSNVLYSLVVRLQETLANTDFWLLFNHPGLDILLWILFMGFAASLRVHGDEYSGDGALIAWFLEGFIQTMGLLRLREYDGVRMILEKFLWIEDVNGRQLHNLWDTIRAARIVDYKKSNPDIVDSFIEAPLDL